MAKDNDLSGDASGQHSPTCEEVKVVRSSSEDITTPAVDDQSEGKAHWIVLAAVCVISMTTWGFGAAFGVFRDYYFHHPPFKGNQVVIAMGVIHLGVMQLLCPVLLQYTAEKSHHRKPMMYFGTLGLVASSLGAAFAKNPATVIVTQGFLYGLSSGLLFAPSISFIDEWFTKRRGLANGLFFGANSLAAAIFAPVFSKLLQEYGRQTTLIAWALFAGCVTFVAVLFVRASQRSHQTHRSRFDRAIFKRPRYWIVVFAIVSQGLAHFMPAAYLPSFATSLGVSPSKAAALISILNAACVIGQAVSGYLVDLIGSLIPLAASAVISALSILLIWGFGHEYWTMILFALTFGCFASIFLVLRSHLAEIILRDTNRPQDETLLSGTLIAARGLSTVVSGFVGAAAASVDASKGVQSGYGAGMWRSVIICDGCLMAGATVGVLAYVGRKK